MPDTSGMAVLAELRRDWQPLIDERRAELVEAS
jgi:hypothetical protein